MNRTQAIFDYDRAIGEGLIAGIDEAGRGSLFGCVVAAACIMPLDDMIDGVFDSKKLTKNARERLFELITKRAIAYEVGVVDHTTIDQINIYQATKLAMCQALEGLKVVPSLVLVDAMPLDCGLPTRAIVSGDATSYNIACASIIAKVTRDRMMVELDAVYPAYGLASNKGYGTAAHLEALRAYGMSPLHRRSFSPKSMGGSDETA